MTRERVTIDRDYLVSEYLAGKSENALAKEFGVDRNTIRWRLKAEGVERRGIGSANALMMSNRTPEEHRRNTLAAHSASRGRTQTFEALCKAALGRERTQNHASPLERQIVSALGGRVQVVPQKAIGPYNCDLAIDGVAVEIFGGQWHFSGRHVKRAPKRFRYILDAGWHVLIVVVDAHYPWQPAMADYIVAFVQEASRDPAARREYRMVRGAGEVIAAGSSDDDDLLVIPALRRSRRASRID